MIYVLIKLKWRPIACNGQKFQYRVHTLIMPCMLHICHDIVRVNKFCFFFIIFFLCDGAIPLFLVPLHPKYMGISILLPYKFPLPLLIVACAIRNCLRNIHVDITDVTEVHWSMSHTRHPAYSRKQQGLTYKPPGNGPCSGHPTGGMTVFRWFIVLEKTEFSCKFKALGNQGIVTGACCLTP